MTQKDHETKSKSVISSKKNSEKSEPEESDKHLLDSQNPSSQKMDGEEMTKAQLIDAVKVLFEK